ncbi:MAG TPA: hypothetical protein VLA51_08345 [Paracoccaceae bacterium]|nr:hypothetical protein [Paracoccaceae bacterium]
MTKAIFDSFRSLPVWVQIWVGLVLIPANIAPLAYLNEPRGVTIAILAAGALAINGVVLLVERGFSRAMAFSHLALWIPLLVIMLPMLQSDAPRLYRLLFAINTVSLAFDFRDAYFWIKGDRAVARKSD